MCLYIGKKLPLIAEKDIVVYKYLDEFDGNYETPYQETPVTLNKTLVANRVNNLYEEVYNEEVYNRKHSISKGAIHACLSIKREKIGNFVLFKAVIKKGTTFYVQDDFVEIAATELFITDEEINCDIDSPDLIDVAKLYIETARKQKENSNSNGVFIGDFCLYDKTYVSPLSDFNKEDAIGIVAFFNNEGNPVVISLEKAFLPWLTESSMENEVCSDIKDNIADDLSGYKHTYDIVASKDYDPNKFKSIAYCTNYQTKGTKKSDWYVGSIGECIKVAQNMGIINASMIFKGIGDIIGFSWMWSSSERTRDDGSCAWGCLLYNGLCRNYYGNRDIVYCVRPLFIEVENAYARHGRKPMTSVVGVRQYYTD